MRVETTKHAIAKLHCGRRSADKWSTRKKSIGLGILILSFYCMTGAVQAQEYPTQPISMLIDRTPGAGTDICSRALAIGASKVLGQEIHFPVNWSLYWPPLTPGRTYPTVH
jgi:hypothetical protein